jgi:hypothetical protein
MSFGPLFLIETAGYSPKMAGVIIAFMNATVLLAPVAGWILDAVGTFDNRTLHSPAFGTARAALHSPFSRVASTPSALCNRASSVGVDRLLCYDERVIRRTGARQDGSRLLVHDHRFVFAIIDRIPTELAPYHTHATRTYAHRSGLCRSQLVCECCHLTRWYVPPMAVLRSHIVLASRDGDGSCS